MKKLTSIFFIFFFSFVANLFAQVTVTNSELDYVGSENLTGTLQPTNEIGLPPSYMSQQLNVSGNGNGGIFPHVTFKRDSLPLNTMVPGTKVVLILKVEQISGLPTPVRFMPGLRRSVGLDTNLNAAILPSDISPSSAWVTLECIIGTNGSPTWDEIRLGVSYRNPSQTLVYKISFASGYILLPNQTTIPFLVGNGTLIVPLPPTGLSPNGINNVPLPPCFDINEQSGVSYRLQVSLTSSFEQNNIVYDQAGIVVWPHCVYTLQPLTQYYWRVTGKYISEPQYGGWSQTAWFTTTYPTGITPIGNGVPSEFSLKQNYPNPFNPVTNISFDVPKLGNIKLAVYDMLGKEVVVLVNETMNPGRYNADWDASALSSGTYFYRLEAEDGFTDVKKMILIK